jgi:hypothetical protein
MNLDGYRLSTRTEFKLIRSNQILLLAYSEMRSDVVLRRGYQSELPTGLPLDRSWLIDSITFSLFLGRTLLSLLSVLATLSSWLTEMVRFSIPCASVTFLFLIVKVKVS